MSETVKLAAISDIHILPDAVERLNGLSGSPLELHTGSDATVDDLVQRTGEAEAVLVSPGTRVPGEYFERCPAVRYIGVCGTSTALVDFGGAEKYGVKISNVQDYGDEPAAEFIFMEITALLRGIGGYQWREEPHELMGKSVGVIGLGALGEAVAHLALAYKTDARYFSLHRKDEWDKKGLKYSEKDELLRKSQIIILTGPTNTEVLSTEDFASINDGSIIVQASIGSVMDREAFISWVERPGNFGVFDAAAGTEVRAAYEGLSNVIFQKVNAGLSYETRQRLGDRVVENLKKYLEGKKT